MIKETDSPVEIKEKLMLVGAFVVTTIAALALGAGQNAPIAGLCGLVAAIFFILKREQKNRRATAAAVEGE